MKASRSASPLIGTPQAPSSGGLIQSWCRFWFTPADPLALHIVRVLAGLLFLAWLLPLASQRDSLFGLQGWLGQSTIRQVSQLPDDQFPPISWTLVYVFGTDSSRLAILYGTAVVAVVLFTLGVATRLTSILTWVAVVSFTANPLIEYEGDVLLRILAFYLMIGYVLLGPWDEKLSPWSLLFGSGRSFLLSRSRGTDTVPPSLGANLALRLLQVHLAIALVATGLHKLQVMEWWVGTALWFPLFPPFETTLADVRAQAPHIEALLGVLSFGAYCVLAWQIGFPLFAWRPRWRFVLLGGAAVAWLGSALLFHIPLVGPALFVGCLSFVSAAEWRRLFARLAFLPGLNRLARPQPIERPESAVKRAESVSMAAVGQR